MVHCKLQELTLKTVTFKRSSRFPEAGASGSFRCKASTHLPRLNTQDISGLWGQLHRQ